MDLSIVVPTYNEEKRIGKTLRNYTSFFKSKKIKYELIVVCNGCRDNTIKIVKHFIKKNKNVKVFDYKDKIGKGGAVLEGFKKAMGENIGFLDADDSFDLERLYGALIKNLGKYDCVIASKWKDQKFFNVTESTTKKILSRCWNLLIKVLFCLKIKDIQAGAKFLTKKALNSIDLNFICNGFEFDVELLVKLTKKGNKIKEVYIPSHDVENSRFSFKYIPSMFFNLLKLWKRSL